MKKTICKAILLFAFAAIFIGCSNSSDENQPDTTPGGNPVDPAIDYPVDSTAEIDEPLFPTEEVPLDASQAQLVDGNWTYRYIPIWHEGAAQLEFSIKDGKFDDSEGARFKYIYSDGNKVMEYSKAAIKKLEKVFQNDPDKMYNEEDYDARAFLYCKHIIDEIDNFEHKLKYSTTNTEQTKFYKQDKESKVYLLKN